MNQNATQPAPSVAFVFGGGGGFGFGFDRGVADGLVDEGIDLFSLPLLGTSAGAIAAASLVAGFDFETVAAQWHAAQNRAGSPWRLDPRDFTVPMFGGVDPADFPCELRTVAVRLPRWQRVVMTTDRFSVVDMVAASCAVPPVVQTVVIDGVRYGDGGFVSGTSADFAPDADLLVVISPICTPIKGPIGTLSSWAIKRETRKWVQRTGGRVLHVPPTMEIASMFSPKLGEIGRIEPARAVYDQSRQLGRDVAGRIWSALGVVAGASA